MPASISSSTIQDAVAYVNGKVYTVSNSQPWIEAFIVSADGKFSAVGSTEEIRAKARKDGLVKYDLRGHFVMPGIHDAHIHILSGGLHTLNGISLDDDTTASNLAERMAHGSCSCAYAHVNSGWLMGSAFLIPEFDRACLDKEFPDTPVAIRGGAGHSLYTNTAFLREAGYDVEREPDIAAGSYKRREDGSLTGELYEMAMNKAMVAIPKPALSHVKRALKTGIRQAHRSGVTSLQEASSNTIILNALSELEQEGALKMDLFTHIVDAPEYVAGEKRKDLHNLIDVADTFESRHVHTKFVKFILDGVPLPPMFSHAALDKDGNIDETNITVSDLVERILEHDSKGRTVKIHATGHGSVRKALNAIETARKKSPDGPKHEIAHCNSIQQDDFARFQELNVTAETSPAFFFSNPLTDGPLGLSDWDIHIEKFTEQGSLVTVGSDWIGSYEPPILPHLARVVDRVGGGSKERGGERLCKILTLAGAEAVGRQDEFGSIDVGKKANFIAVSSNLAKGEFEEAKVLKTWFEGELVWDRDDP